MYRIRSIRCPRCAGEVFETAPGRMSCRGCGAEHVSPETMVELVRAAAPDLRLRTGGVVAFPRGVGAARRACPDCSEPMTAGVLFEVMVDQCPSHGIWYDRDGLERVLENARTRFEERARR